jgi:hypothetical protein
VYCVDPTRQAIFICIEEYRTHPLCIPSSMRDVKSIFGLAPLFSHRNLQPVISITHAQSYESGILTTSAVAIHK